MKRLFVTLALSLLLCIGLVAQTKELAKASVAYQQEQYQSALRIYEDLGKTHGVSSDLFYNIANCHYRLGGKGKAVLYYEKALVLDPANSDARENLALVNTKIADKYSVDEINIISTIANRIVDWHSADSWAIISIVVLILLLICVSLYIFVDIVWLRKVGFFAGILFAIFTLCSITLAFVQSSRTSKHSEAVVTQPQVTLSTSPREPKTKSEEAFVLHEGTKVQILDSLETTSTSDNGQKTIWLDVKADNSHRAWVKKTDVEVI